MNDSKSHQTDKNHAIVLIGSNIDPINNITAALHILHACMHLTQVSRTWETAAIGSNDANFFNVAFSAFTDLKAIDLKDSVLLSTEKRLGRVRTENKNAARTMDLDIIIFNHNPLDKDLWKKAFIALPVADLEPNLKNPIDGMKLIDVAKRLQKDTFAVVRNDINFII